MLFLSVLVLATGGFIAGIAAVGQPLDRTCVLAAIAVAALLAIVATLIDRITSPRRDNAS